MGKVWKRGKRQLAQRLWFYVEENVQQGPVSDQELRQYLASGKLSTDTLVWSEGMAQWQPAGSVAGLRAESGEPFSLTELVLFYGDRFATKAGMLGNSNVELLLTGGEAAYDQLARVVLPLAVLANEQAGVLRLEVRQKKALLGLRSVQYLEAIPAGGRASWPAGCLEDRAQALVNPGPRAVEDLLYALLQADSNNAYAQAVGLVQEGLAGRGYLVTEQFKKVKVFTMTRYALADGTRELASGRDVGGIQALLGSVQQGRPEVWKLLLEATNKALSRRTESSDMDFDTD